LKSGKDIPGDWPGDIKLKCSVTDLTNNLAPKNTAAQDFQSMSNASRAVRNAVGEGSSGIDPNLPETFGLVGSGTCSQAGYG